MLYNLIISPIESIVDWVFVFLCRLTHDHSVIFPVIGVSLVINFLALPLYNIADSLQEKERKITKKMEYRVKRIKKAFKGDEQFMMLSTYYRQNGYHPLYVLRSSLSILIEIPFFIAAYHYLSNCRQLLGSSFWIFKDLGAPDELFTLNFFGKALVINVLPILMTVINFISGAIYTKEAPAKEKVQLYVVALIFLVLLYNSPSGLVIYWILNNLFSLVKNVVMKQKNPKKILYFSIIGLAACALLFFTLLHPSVKKVIVSLAVMFILCVPLIVQAITRKHPLTSVKKIELKLDSTNFVLTIIAGLSLSLLAGLLLPSSVISTSPREFCYLGNTDNPVSYIKTAFFVFLGLFCLWPAVIYKMFGEKVQKAEPLILFAMEIFGLLNAFVFKTAYDELSVWYRVGEVNSLLNENPLITVLSILALAAPIVIYILADKFNKRNILTVVLISLCLAEAGLGIVNTRKINNEFYAFEADLAERAKTEGEVTVHADALKPSIHFSKTKQNVVVFFLDRAISSFFPQALEEIPQLKEQFKGFTYYPNTLSLGTNTNISVPSIFGGYDYSPDKINERSSELLKDKHNEALRVLPSLFEQGGYKVSIYDPPAVNYEWKGDLSPLRDGTNFTIKEFAGKYSELCKSKIGYDNTLEAQSDEISRKELRNFTILQMLPSDFRKTFYKTCTAVDNETTTFYSSFSTLYFLNDLTDFTEEEKPVFIYLDNETTHRQMSLIAPDYMLVDTTRHDHEHNPDQEIGVIEHYDVNVASYIQIGKWLDYLRENGVYDNTRIILMSDHGFHIPLPVFKNFTDSLIPSSFNSLLMEKDFNCNDPVKVDNSLMCAADTLFLAKEGLGLSDTAPDTGKKLVQADKEKGIVVYKQFSDEWNVEKMKKKKVFTLYDKQSWLVKDNIFDEKNWTSLEQLKKLQEEK